MQQQQVVKRQSRFSKGVVIAAGRRILKMHNEDAWLVESETTDGKYYKVTSEGLCECADWRFRGQTCKHAYAIIRRAVTQ
jgi:hypothetical protein